MLRNKFLILEQEVALGCCASCLKLQQDSEELVGDRHREAVDHVGGVNPPEKVEGAKLPMSEGTDIITFLIEVDKAKYFLPTLCLLDKFRP